MRNYDEMTHAELIEIIKSLEMVQPKLITESGILDKRDSSINDAQKILSPTLINLNTIFSENDSLLKWVFDPKTLSCPIVNEVALDYFGYSRAEFLSLKLFNSLPPGFLPIKNEPDMVGDASKAKSGTWQYRGENGKVGFLEGCALDIICADEPFLLIFASDVSKKFQMEFELVQVSY